MTVLSNSVENDQRKMRSRPGILSIWNTARPSKFVELRQRRPCLP